MNTGGRAREREADHSYFTSKRNQLPSTFFLLMGSVWLIQIAPAFVFNSCTHVHTRMSQNMSAESQILNKWRSKVQAHKPGGTGAADAAGGGGSGATSTSTSLVPASPASPSGQPSTPDHDWFQVSGAGASMVNGAYHLDGKNMSDGIARCE